MKRIFLLVLSLILFSTSLLYAEYLVKEDTDETFFIKLVDSTDFDTPETGKTAADTTVQYSTGTGAGWSTYDDTGMFSEIGTGIYSLTIGASEFVDNLRYTVRVAVLGACDFNFKVNVIDNSSNEWLALVKGMSTTTNNTDTKINANLVAIGTTTYHIDTVGVPTAAAVTTVNDKTGYALAFAQYTNISNNIFGTSLSTYVYDGSAGGYIVNASTGGAGGGATAQQVWEYGTRSLTDKAGFSLASGQEVTVSSFTSTAQGDMQEALTNQGLTTTRTPYLDNLNTGVTLAAAQAVTVSSFTAAAQTDVQESLTNQGYTTTRAPYIDALNTGVTVSSMTSAGQTEIQEAISNLGWTAARAGYQDQIPAISSTTQHINDVGVPATQVVASVSGAVNSVTGGVTVTTNNDKTGYTASTVSDKTGYGLAANAINNGTFSDEAATKASTFTWVSNLSGNEPTAAGYMISASSEPVSVSTTTVAQGVWNALKADYNTALTMGNAMNSAASAGDPWSTLIPAAYGLGTAGYITGHLNDYIIPTSTGVAHIDNNLPTGGGTDF